MSCPGCGAPVRSEGGFCASCGAPLPGAGAALPPPPPPGGDAGLVATVIPTKNPRALVAYYLGVFSVIPCVGSPLGLAALVLGILGVRFARAHPEAKGAVHAWIGIVAGGIFGILWTVLAVLVLAGALRR